MTKKQKKIIQIFLNFIIVALLIFSSVLIFNKPIAHSKMAQGTNEYLINNIPKETLDQNNNNPGNFDIEGVESLDPTNIPPATDDLPVIAGITIPDIGINLPIFKGLDNTSLAYGAGTTSENQKMGQGNYGLASHHVFGMWGASSLLFSPLDYAQIGQKIYMTDKENIYVYEIYNIENVAPNAGYVLDDIAPNETPICTLVTCTDIYATARKIVQGRLFQTIPYDAAQQQIKDAFKAEYNAFQA